MNPPLLDEPPQTVIPRPPRFLRILLVVFEVCAWATAALLTSMSAVAALIYSAGDVPVAARLIDGASLIENGGGTVESGMVDVVLEDVPFAVSWPYLLVIVAGVFLWAVLCVSLARISRGLRAGAPFRSVTPGFLYGLTAVWTVVALVVAVLATGSRMWSQHRVRGVLVRESSLRLS